MGFEPICTAPVLPRNRLTADKVQLFQLEDARAFCQTFFSWYNQEHQGIGLLTPEMMHTGQAQVITQKRQDVLDDAYRAHSERFVSHPPIPPVVPKAVWINPPTNSHKDELGRL